MMDTSTIRHVSVLPYASHRNVKAIPYGESIHANAKFKGIDGKTQQDDLAYMAQFDYTQHISLALHTPRQPRTSAPGTLSAGGDTTHRGYDLIMMCSNAVHGRFQCVINSGNHNP